MSIFLLAYRSLRHETTGVTLAELYFARDLRLPLDLLQEKPPKLKRKDSYRGYVLRLRKKVEEIHNSVREWMDLKPSRIKSR